jgi:hypothetical protein
VSTGLECQFFEPKPGQWFYALQDWNCPVGAWDWRDYATAYGPFTSQEAAERHLSSNHANPGGWNVTEHARFRTSPTYDRLVKEARKPR